MTIAFRTITYDVRDHVAVIALNVPDRKNVIGLEMANELVTALDYARADSAVRVVVLAANGDVFCAGGDLSSMPTGGGDPLPARGDFADLLIRFSQMEKPTVARVHGPALGGGVGLVASCDLAIAVESATFATPEIRRGFFPFMISMPLSRTMPRKKLMEMILLGEKWSAAEAREAGLVSHVVADAALGDTLARITAQLGSFSPTAMRMGLAALRANLDEPFDEAIPRMRDALIASLATDDAKEGMAAFLEKRPPKWSGQ